MEHKNMDENFCSWTPCAAVWFTAMPGVLFIFGYYDCELRLFVRFMFFMIFTSFLDFYGPFK